MFQARTAHGVRCLLPMVWLWSCNTGCVDFDYLIPAAIGQSQILSASVPIVSILRDSATSPELAEKLQLVIDARDFARRRIGLYTLDQYDTFYDSGGDPVAFNLSAARRERLESYDWWFPIVGEVPYLAFFDREHAERRAASLEARGYDTFIYELDAYNAGNFFSNPVMSPMLERPTFDVVNVIIHELLHSTIFAPDDTTFNESLATFVGQTGAVQFFEVRDAEEGTAARQYFEDVARFDRFAGELLDDLDDFYNGPGTAADKIAGRQAVYDAARARFTAEVQSTMHHPERFDFVQDIPTNNAYLLGLQRYARNLELFEAVWVAQDRAWYPTLNVFREAAAAPQPFAWLQRWVADAASGKRSPATVTTQRTATAAAQREPCRCRLHKTLLEAAWPAAWEP